MFHTKTTGFAAIICTIMVFNVSAEFIDFDDPALGHLDEITNYYAGVTFNGIENIWPNTPDVSDPYILPDNVGDITILGGAAIWNPISEDAPGESAPNFAVGLGYNNPGDGGILMTFDDLISNLVVTGLDYGNGETWLDDEYMTLTAYDVDGNKLGFEFYTDQFAPGAVLGSIAFENMKYVAFNYSNTNFGFLGIDDLDYTPMSQNVPEPMTFSMLGIALITLAATGVRRKK